MRSVSRVLLVCACVVSAVVPAAASAQAQTPGDAPLLAELTPTMSNLNLTLPPLLTNLNTQIADVGPLVSNLNATLPGVLTQANLTLGDVRTNTLPAANQLLTNSAEFVGGLKRHWLFRGAFKTNAPKVKSN